MRWQLIEEVYVFGFQVATESENKMESLAHVVTELGRRFYPSETAYPLGQCAFRLGL